MKMDEVLSRELEEISLSRDEIVKLKKVADDFIELLRKRKINVVVGGSLAKGTLIRKEKQDVDIFVVFRSEKEISGLGKILKSLKLAGKMKVVHGSRDYFQIAPLDRSPHRTGLVLLEVVPIVENKKPELAGNVTDVSLSHVKFVVGEIRKNPRLADEIKLAKAFCYANRCYGAESYIHGFSGYALEVLIIYYGGFVNFLRKIGKKKVVDLKKFFRSDVEVLREINSAKLGSPIVVVDPTYKFRNVTAGLNEETFEKFVKVGREFLKKPSLDFFELKSLRDSVFGVSGYRGMGNVRFVEVELSTDRQEGNIAGAKMKKVFDFFVRELERNGQKVLRNEFDYSGLGNRALGYLVVNKVDKVEFKGPPCRGMGIGGMGVLDVDVGNFLRVNKGRDVFKKKGFWFVRREVSIEGVLEMVKEKEREMGASLRFVGRGKV